MHFHLSQSDPLSDLWSRVRGAIIDGANIDRSRYLVATLLEALRHRGDMEHAHTLRSWVVWIGYPVSDSQLKNRFSS